MGACGMHACVRMRRARVRMRAGGSSQARQHGVRAHAVRMLHAAMARTCFAPGLIACSTAVSPLTLASVSRTSAPPWSSSRRRSPSAAMAPAAAALLLLGWGRVARAARRARAAGACARALRCSGTPRADGPAPRPRLCNVAATTALAGRGAQARPLGTAPFPRRLIVFSDLGLEQARRDRVRTAGPRGDSCHECVCLGTRGQDEVGARPPATADRRLPRAACAA